MVSILPLILVLLISACSGNSAFVKSISEQGQQLAQEEQAWQQELLVLDDLSYRQEQDEKRFISSLSNEQLVAYINLMDAWRMRDKARGLLAYRHLASILDKSKLDRFNELMNRRRYISDQFGILQAKYANLEQRKGNYRRSIEAYQAVMLEQKAEKERYEQQQLQASNEALRRYEENNRWYQLLGAIENLKNSGVTVVYPQPR